VRPLLQGCETEARRAQSAAGRASLTIPVADGARVVNARGVPGSVGFLAVTRHDHRLVVVTAHHVLFGAGAPARTPVWLAHPLRGGSFERLGQSLYGRAGIVHGRASGVYVDCGVASIHWANTRREVWPLDDPGPGAETSLTVGDRVTKVGAATGFTEGIVQDVSHRVPAVRHRAIEAPGQLLVRSAVRGRPFAAEGDSGAAVRDGNGRIVGLLWASTAAGEGIATPIAPVLYVLHVTPVLWAPNDND